MSFTGPQSLTSSDEFTNVRCNEPVSLIVRLGDGSSSSIYSDENHDLEIPSDLSRIPLEHIKQATNNFAQENIIQKKYDWKVYKGELSGKKLAFILVSGRFIESFALRVLSELSKHQNIVSLIGICDEDYPNMILVVEHLTRGGLDKHVTGAHLTWLMRVQISLDIASGVHYLQNHDKPHKLNSSSIHLDEKWQAKIQFITPHALVYARAPAKLCFDKGQLGYVDPSYTYSYTYAGTTLSEIYSFGVILFELLCARPAVTYDEEGGTQFLSKLACSHYEKGTLTEFIDPVLRVQMNRDSFAVFSELAYRCLNENQYRRPTISEVVEELQKVLKLQQGFEISELQQVRICKNTQKGTKSDVNPSTRD